MRTFMPACAALVVALALPVAAQKPVKSIEDGALDKIELFVATLDRAGELTIAIKAFDTTKTELGTGGSDGSEARQKEAKTMQADGPRMLNERFATTLEKGPFKSVIILKDGEAAPAGALVVEGKFVTLDPGSRAKRYFAGFGAGKSSVEVAGSVKDGSGKTLATFEQRRIGAMGIGGGDSLEKLMSDSRSIGEDIAKFLTKWARGEKLD